MNLHSIIDNMNTESLKQVNQLFEIWNNEKFSEVSKKYNKEYDNSYYELQIEQCIETIMLWCNKKDTSKLLKKFWKIIDKWRKEYKYHREFEDFLNYIRESFIPDLEQL